MKVIRVLAFTGALSMLIAACGSGDESPNTDDNVDSGQSDSGTAPDSADDAETAELSDLTLRLNWTPYAADHAFYYYGVEEGIYADYGIDLNIEPGNGSATVLKLVDNGSDPIALLDAATMLGGIQAGMDVSMVAAINQQSPMAFVFRADSPIEEASDLPGKKIVVTEGDALSQVLPAVLNSAGIDPSSVEVISSPTPAAKETAVLQGQADTLLAFYTEQPLRMESVTGEKMAWKPFSDFGVNTFNMGFVMNNSWHSDNPELAQNFIKATQEAIEKATSDPSAAAAAFVTAVPDFDLELAEKQVEATLPLLHTEASEGKPYGWMDESDWEATISVLAEYADLKIDDVSAVYTNDLVE